MTIPEITAYVMALTPDDVRRLTATDVMGWTMKNVTDYTDEQTSYWFDADVRIVEVEDEWRPDTDRNQSRQVTDKVLACVTSEDMREAMRFVDACRLHNWWAFVATPDQESRAALIAHMIHAEESKNVE